MNIWWEFLFISFWKTYDASAMPLATTYNRHKAVDITNYLAIEGNSIAYKYPTLEPDVAGFIRPFSIEVNVGTAKNFILHWKKDVVIMT